MEHSEESQDEEQCINLEEERTKIAALDLISLKAETLRDAVLVRKIEVDSSSYAVPMLPSFKIGAGVKDPLMLEPYGKHKLIRNREPAILGSLQQGSS